nr:hypothetical protein [Thalassobacillus sp. C254]
MKKLPKTGLDKEQFWADFDKLIHELTPENKSLLEKREEIQSQLDNWYKENKGSFDFDKYKAFLEEIGYLESVPEDFEVTTSNVDEAVTKQAGPQLVVPVNNARYAINAANAVGEVCMMHFTERMQSVKRAALKKAQNTILHAGTKLLHTQKNFWTTPFRCRKDPIKMQRNMRSMITLYLLLFQEETKRD